MVEKIEENEAGIGMRCWMIGVGGWVGGWEETYLSLGVCLCSSMEEEEEEEEALWSFLCSGQLALKQAFWIRGGEEGGSDVWGDGGWVEEKKAVGMGYCMRGVGGWVGGWVGKRRTWEQKSVPCSGGILSSRHLGQAIVAALLQVGEAQGPPVVELLLPFSSFLSFVLGWRWVARWVGGWKGLIDLVCVVFSYLGRGPRRPFPVCPSWVVAGVGSVCVCVCRWSGWVGWVG